MKDCTSYGRYYFDDIEYRVYTGIPTVLLHTRTYIIFIYNIKCTLLYRLVFRSWNSPHDRIKKIRLTFKYRTFYEHGEMINLYIIWVRCTINRPHKYYSQYELEWIFGFIVLSPAAVRNRTMYRCIIILCTQCIYD